MCDDGTRSNIDIVFINTRPANIKQPPIFGSNVTVVTNLTVHVFASSPLAGSVAKTNR